MVTDLVASIRTMLNDDRDPKYVKGHWRLAQGYLSQKNFGLACDAFDAALRVEPTNKAVKKELDKCKVREAS